MAESPSSLRHQPSCTLLPAYLNSSNRRLTNHPAIDQLSPKEEKIIHPAFPPPIFWDNLSEIALTKNALRELNRRNTVAASSLPRGTNLHPSHRFLTRCASHKQEAACASIQSAAQYTRRANQAELEQIRHFARQGGPDLTDLRAYRNKPIVDAITSRMPQPKSVLGRRRREIQDLDASLEDSQTPTSTKSIGPYDRTFQQHLIDHGIYPIGFEYPDCTEPPPPDNLEEIKAVLTRRRRSLSPSRFTAENYRDFTRAETKATKEWEIVSGALPSIEGDVEGGGHASGQVLFTNLNHLTDGTLTAGNPDRYYGSYPAELCKEVREELNEHIVPSTQSHLPIVPNFFLAVKGPSGLRTVADLQACYDGTLGARGMHSLQTYGETGERGPDNNAYTITCTYGSQHLILCATHAFPPNRWNPSGGYVTTLIGAYSMIGGVEGFRIGAAAYRNARDWAKKVRDEAIGKANEVVARRKASPSASLQNSASSRQTPVASLDDPENSANKPEPKSEAPLAKRRRLDL